MDTKAIFFLISQSLSDALGLAIHFANTMGGVLQLPLSHFGRFRGSNSEIWQQEEFWNVTLSKDACCLFVQTTSPNKTGDSNRASFAKGIEIFLRSLAIASEERMHSIAISDFLASPVQYVTYVLSLSAREVANSTSNPELHLDDETGKTHIKQLIAVEVSLRTPYIYI
jgi:hypothetical protein